MREQASEREREGGCAHIAVSRMCGNVDALCYYRLQVIILWSKLYVAFSHTHISIIDAYLASVHSTMMLKHISQRKHICLPLSLFLLPAVRKGSCR